MKRIRTFSAVLATAVLAMVAVATEVPANAAATCTTSGPGGYTVTVCIDEPSVGDTLSGQSVIVGSVDRSDGAATTRLMRFSLDGGYVLTDFNAPYTFRLPTARWVDGQHTLSAVAEMRDGFESQPVSVAITLSNGVTTPPGAASTFRPRVGTTPAPGDPFVVAVVGDSGSSVPRTVQVSDLVNSWDPNMLLYLGDVYEEGTYTEFLNWYGGPTTAWGRMRSITNPTIGNHEYEFEDGRGYNEYWNTPPAYYSVDTAGWHVISLNTNIPTSSTSAQYAWLQRDLADNAATPCTLVFLHDPRYTQSSYGDDGTLNAIWPLLHRSGVDIVVAGHNHAYERWKPLDDQGEISTDGMTQFVVGTGGHTVHAFTRSDPRVAVSFDTFPQAAGALRLELGGTGANFSYTDLPGEVLDRGSIPCRGTSTPPPPPPPPPSDFSDGFESGNLSAWTAVRGDVSVASGDAVSGTEAARAVTVPGVPANIVKDLPSRYSSISAATSFKVVSRGSNRLTLARLRRAGGANIATVFLSTNGTLMLRDDLDGSTYWSSVNVPTGGWHRLQLRATVAGDASTVGVSYDGRQLSMLTRTLPLGTSPVAKLVVGDTNADGPSEVLFDDVVVGGTASSSADVTPPSTPTAVRVTAESSSSAVVSWDAATDDTGVTGYDVYRDGTRVASEVVGATFRDASLLPGTTYSYRVRAVDAAGNESPSSAVAAVTTPSAASGDIVADDFESGDLSAWDLVRGSVSIATGDATSGAGALVADGSGGATVANVVRVLATPADELYQRTAFKITDQSDNQVNLLRLQTTDERDVVTAFVSSSGYLMLRNDRTGTNLWSGVTVSADTWHTLVLRVRAAGDNSQVEVWYDGARVDELTKTVALGSVQLGRVMVGDEVRGRSYRVLFDDVRVSTEPVNP